MENQQLPKGRRTKALNEAIEAIIEAGMTSMGEYAGYDYEESDFTFDDVEIAYKLILKKMFSKEASIRGLV